MNSTKRIKRTKISCELFGFYIEKELHLYHQHKKEKTPDRRKLQGFYLSVLLRGAVGFDVSGLVILQQWV